MYMFSCKSLGVLIEFSYFQGDSFRGPRAYAFNSQNLKSRSELGIARRQLEKVRWHRFIGCAKSCQWRIVREGSRKGSADQYICPEAPRLKGFCLRAAL